MQSRNSKFCEASKCIVYSAVNHPWWMGMLFDRRCLAVDCLGCSLQNALLNGGTET